MEQKPKGFAALSPERRKEIASIGGEGRSRQGQGASVHLRESSRSREAWRGQGERGPGAHEQDWKEGRTSGEGGVINEKFFSYDRTLSLDNTSRHLIFTICPLRNWRDILKTLSEGLHIFNGSRTFAILTANPNEKSQPGLKQVRLDPVEDVVKVLDDINGKGLYEYFTVPNDLKLRETVTFVPLLQAVSAAVKKDSYVLGKRDKTALVLYAHTKSVTYDPKVTPANTYKAVQIWTAALFHHNLDRFPAVLEMLQYYPICGSFKRYGDSKKFKGFDARSRYHYAGTFFWFKMAALEERDPDFSKVPQTRFGTEAYLSILFDAYEAGCLFGENILNPYDGRAMELLCNQTK